MSNLWDYTCVVHNAYFPIFLKREISLNASEKALEAHLSYSLRGIKAKRLLCLC